MTDERIQPRTTWPAGIEQAAQAGAETLSRAMRELLPFASTDMTGGLPLMPLAMMPGSGASLPQAVDAVPAVGEAVNIISRAAGILDDEMARGVLAARDVSPGPTYNRGAGTPVTAAMQQVHELIDNIARAWPPVAGNAATPAAAPRSGPTSSSPVPELRPPNRLQPGERATLSMTVRNHENRAVQLGPAATPLLGSNGHRIPSQLLEFSPQQLTLEPGASQVLQMTVTVPALCPPGCYFGLLVVTGSDYVRALIAVEVTDRP